MTVQQTHFYARALPFRHGGRQGHLIVCFNKQAAHDMHESGMVLVTESERSHRLEMREKQVTSLREIAGPLDFSE